MTKKPIATTAAATRKTRSIESENPVLNGSARKSGSFWMNEVSDRSPPPLQLAALQRLGRPGGRWPRPACSALPILSGSVVNRIDRNAATPIVPPIWRKNVTDDVATPISRGRDGVLHGQDDRLEVEAEARRPAGP